MNLRVLLVSLLVLSGCEGTVLPPSLEDASAADAAAADATQSDTGLSDAGSQPTDDAGLQPGEDGGSGGPDAARGDAGPSDAQTASTDWDAPHALRRVVTLVPHPTRARVDLPVLVDLDEPGAFVQRGVVVRDLTDPAHPTIPASIWTDSDGRGAQVGFTARGTTPAGQSRTFSVYYDTAPTPAVWSWAPGDWASRQVLPGGKIGISGGCCGVVREVDEAAKRLRSGRRTGQATALTLLSSNWKAAEGFANAYQLESGTTSWPTLGLESSAYSALGYDGDAAQAAFDATWTLTAPVAHETRLTQRVFKDWPFVQYRLSVRSASAVNLSSNAYSSRNAYLTQTFDRMRADTFADSPLASKWDTAMRWFVVHDSGTGRGVGWYSANRGVLRADNQSTATNLFDSYGYSGGHGLTISALWMPAQDKNAIVDLFDALSPGVQVGLAESRDLNILAPEDGGFFFPQDSLVVRVSTPGSTAAVTASWRLPDGSTLPVTLARVGSTPTWAGTPLLLTAAHPEGAWKLTATSGTATREVTVQVRHPTHPHLLFGAADLSALRAKRTTTHAAIWAELLAAVAKYPAPVEDPTNVDIRNYANRLTTLALVQLLDPSQPFAPRMREYLFKMLRYPNWSGSPPFNNSDLTIGHFQAALAYAYDWHYDALTPEERREIRARLTETNDRALALGWIAWYPPTDWARWGSVTNNHNWIRNGGVAAGAFVLEGEVDEARRQAWVTRTEANLQVILDVVGHDGSSNEGVAYDSYGQINLFPWIDARNRALGGNKEKTTDWFAKTVLWQRHSIAPGGTDNYGGPANFGDCPPYHYYPPRTIQSWLGARLQDGLAQWMAEELQLPRAPEAFTYLWYEPSVTAVSADARPTWNLAGERGIFAWRSSWANDAAYFSLKSGSYFGGHEQPDAGHFILHRAGVPYVVDLGYSYLKRTDEHNLVLADGKPQWGADQQWMASVDPAHWAQVPEVLADDAYFDLVTDATRMSQSTDLQLWRREVLGFGPSFFLVRDELQAGKPISFTWLLHGYKTNPPTSLGATYDLNSRRLENPFVDQGAGRWLLQPQAGAPDLHLADLSVDAWSAIVEPTLYVPETKPTGGYNENFETAQLGHRLRRTRSASSTSSLVAAWFGDAVSATALGSAQAEGALLRDTGGDLLLAVWPRATTAATLSGLTVTGAMGGRRVDLPAYFGRGVTRLEKDGLQLLSATTPVSAFVRFEHAATPGSPRFATLSAAADSQVVLHCPQAPSQVLVDGTSVAVNWASSRLTVDVTKGTHRIELR